MSTNKAESNRAKLTSEAYDLHKLGFSGGVAPKAGPMMSQNEVDAMLGGVDIMGLEMETPVKTVATSLPKLELKQPQASEPVSRAAIQHVEQQPVQEPIREPEPQVAQASTEEGHSFAHFFQAPKANLSMETVA